MPGPATVDELGNEILRSLRRILRRVSLHSRQISRDAGLTLPQVLCMRALRDAPGGRATLVDISRAVQLTAPTLTGIIDRLEVAGLAHRERSTTDRRKIHVSLTERGRERLEHVPVPLQARFLERLGELSEAEQSELLRGLNRIVELMDAEEIDAAPILLSDADVRSEGES